MGSILESFDEPITKEFLLEHGFALKLNTDQMDLRYNLAEMSNEEYADMIKENLYYERNVLSLKTSSYVRITYWPDTYLGEHYNLSCRFNPYVHISDLHKNSCKNDTIKDLADHMYNLELEYRGSNFTWKQMLPTRIYAEDTKDIIDYIAAAEHELKNIENSDGKYSSMC